MMEPQFKNNQVLLVTIELKVLTLLTILPGGLLLLHPRILRHINTGRPQTVRHVHREAAAGRRVLRTHRRPVRHLARQVGQRRHELRHRRLTVDEPRLIAALQRQAGMLGGGRRGGQPEAAAAGRRTLRRVGARLNHHEVLLL